MKSSGKPGMQSYINPREREMDKLVQIAKVERAKVSFTII